MGKGTESARDTEDDGVVLSWMTSERTGSVELDREAGADLELCQAVVVEDAT